MKAWMRQRNFLVILVALLFLVLEFPFCFALPQKTSPTVTDSIVYDSTHAIFYPSNSPHYDYDTPINFCNCTFSAFSQGSFHQKIPFRDFFSGQAGKGLGQKVVDILKGKKGSIKDAPLPKGSPSWEEIAQMTLEEIRQKASQNIPGFKTVQKLLTDSRFNR